MEKFTKYDEFKLQMSYERSYDELMLSYDDYFEFLRYQNDLFKKKQRWGAYINDKCMYEQLLDTMGCARN